MRELNWMDELNRLAKEAAWYQQWLQVALDLEEAFCHLRGSLSPEQQELLDSYISACENMESARTVLAYDLGWEQGMRTVVSASIV